MGNNYSIFKKNTAFFLLLLFTAAFSIHGQIVQTYTYTGAMQSFTVPSCVNNVTIEVWGAQGGTATGYTLNSNLGGYAKGTFPVTANDVLNIYVGGKPSSITGGFNGGGNGDVSGAGGGGASDVRFNGTAFSNRIIVGGGGGGAGIFGADQVAGGEGGGLTGGDGYRMPSYVANPGGQGGTQTGSGHGTCGTTMNFAVTGGIGVGGVVVSANCNGCDGYGGGGGYYGGAGSGNCRGGGGGSGYLSSSATNTVFTNGIQTSHGKVVLTYNALGNSVGLTASSTSLCIGSTATLTAASMLSYTWAPGGSNASSITVTPNTTSSYTVQGTNLQGCHSQAIVTLTVDTAIPVLTVANTASSSAGICPNTTVMLTASGAPTYTWTGPASVMNGVPFGPTIAGTYIVTGANACGSTTAATSVSVHPLPVVNPSASNSTLCAGSGLTLTATGNATNYVWSGGSAPPGNGVGFFPSPSTITYSVIGTSALSCTALATIPVTVHATPVQVPSASPPLICTGNSSTLTATGALSYTWMSSTQTVNTPTFVVTPAGTGITTYTVIKSNSTCSDTKTISVITNPLPSIFAIASPPTVCALQPSTLSIGGGISYTWTAPGTPNFTFTGASPVVYPPTSSNYTVAASDGTCISITTVSVTANANPTITASPTSPTLCIGQQVTIQAYGGNSYTWTSPGGTLNAPSITDSPTTAVAYNVSGDNAFGCVATAQQVILVYSLPPTSALATKPMVCSGGPSTLIASGAHSYTWDPAAGGVISSSVVVNPTSPASSIVIYTVTGSYTTTGCAFSKTVQISVFVPTLSVSGTTIACVGGQISLTAAGGNPNSYTWTTGSSTSTFPSLTTTIAAAAVFTVSATGNSLSVSGCSATRTVAVDAYPNPTVTAIAERSVICPKESTQLFADGGVSYTWSNAMSGATITVSPLSQTNNYTVTGTSSHGCVSTGSVQVKLQSCTGIEELSAKNNVLLIYPNPSNGQFTVLSGSDMELNLVNELGQPLRKITLNSANDHKAEIRDVPQGIYFLQGETRGLPVAYKLVIH